MSLQADANVDLVLGIMVSCIHELYYRRFCVRYCFTVEGNMTNLLCCVQFVVIIHKNGGVCMYVCIF
jgi:hypothetical protein